MSPDSGRSEENEGSRREHIRRELARGTSEMAVLSALAGGRRYGYELLKRLQRPGGGVLDMKEGTLYPLLHRLEDAGHVAATWHAEGRARPRKFYELTSQGRAHLEVLRSEWAALVAAMEELMESLGADGATRPRNDEEDA